ncbi:MAG TPA: BTAD domain-containing putative transcriptional regulator [Acidimicrobiia bacterium]|nr:BTAD domain-containing putative transcriptional regulator [Acidimicrobiia bacterium]
MQYRALGSLEAISPDGELVPLGGVKQRRVLACLLVHHNEVVSADRLIDVTWGTDIPASPKSALQTYISRLRKNLGEEAISAKSPGYVLRVGPDDLDALVFERLVADGRRMAELGSHESAVERFDAGLAMWSGEAYADFLYEDFARGEAERLQELRRSAVEDRLESLIELGRHREAIPRLEQALEENPLRERLWHAFMVALYRDGRQADALRAFSQARQKLIDELGVEPGPDLRDLEERILMQDPSLSGSGKRDPAGLPEGEVTFLVATSVDEVESDETSIWPMLKAKAGEHGGTVVQELSEQRLVVFDTPRSAIETAIDVQRDEAGSRLALAIHVTEAHLRRGEYVSNGVSRILRVGAVAAPTQIVLTAAAARALTPLDPPARLEFLEDLFIPGMSSPEPLYALWHSDSSPRIETVASQPKTNLQSGGLTSFVGRGAEIQEIRSSTVGHRLVTLVGPGGVGKTRLAFQVAADLVGRHSGGVWIVELAPLEPSLIEAAILETLRIEPFPDETWTDAVARHARHGSLFIVLDNCEHVIDHVAAAVDQLLRASEHVHILATSRERLGVPGEFVFQVSGLATPAANESIDPSKLSENESVALFVARGRNVRPEFDVDGDIAHAVATVCRRLDGMPLAIELAASRLDVLTPVEIADRLDDRFRLLVSRARGIPARQKTLEAVIDWSYELLSESEQVLLRTLAVFRGTFDIEAVEDVCAGPEVPAEDVLDMLSGLVSKSLVTVAVGSGATRYSLLETVNAYATRLLDASGERDDIGDRHADHYRRLARAWEQNEPPIVNHWWNRLIAQEDNMRSALEWIAHNRPVEEFVETVADLEFFWLFRSRTAEGLEWARRALEESTDAEDLRIRALRGAGPLAAEEQQYDEARKWTDESLRYWIARGNRLEAASDLNNLANIARMQGSLDEALSLVSECIALLEESQDRSYPTVHKLCGSHLTHGETLAELGRLDEAEATARTGLEMEESIETDSYLHHDGLRVMGQIALAGGRVEEAEEWFRRSDDIAEVLGADFVVRSRNGLATVALIMGDLDEAEAILREASAMLDARAADRLESLRLLSLTLLATGRPQDAEQVGLEMLTNSSGGAGERLLAQALNVVGICRAALGDRRLASTLMHSSAASRRGAGLVTPAWERSLTAEIGQTYGVRLEESADDDDSNGPLSPGTAARLVLGGG